MYKVMGVMSSEECTWGEREYQLAAWAFRKWKYHQFTSLRVSAHLALLLPSAYPFTRFSVPSRLNTVHLHIIFAQRHYASSSSLCCVQCASMCMTVLMSNALLSMQTPGFVKLKCQSLLRFQVCNLKSLV